MSICEWNVSEYGIVLRYDHHKGTSCSLYYSESTSHVMSSVMAGDYQLVFYTRNTPDEVKMERYIAG